MPEATDPQRKTLDERNQMSELARLRHSTAHILATAIAKLWPDAQFAAGPPVENGFYYDVDTGDRPLTPAVIGGLEQGDPNAAPWIDARPKGQTPHTAGRLDQPS